MSLVTSLTAMPGRLAAVLGTCEYFGGRISRSQLNQLISPGSLRGEGNPDEENPSAVVTEVVSEAKALGLVVLDGPDVVLTDKAQFALADLQGFLMPIMTSSAAASEHGQEDFPLLLVWLLRQNPDRAIAWGGTPVGEIRSMAGNRADIDRLLPKNSQAFQQFHYWARFLGFSEWVTLGSTTGVLPIPTRALRWSFAAGGIARGELIPARDFLAAISRNCGVFDGGVTREVLEGAAGERSYTVGHTVSGSLGIAIKAMVISGELSVETRDDADLVAIVTLDAVADRGDRFSHVMVTP